MSAIASGKAPEAFLGTGGYPLFVEYTKEIMNHRWTQINTDRSVLHSIELCYKFTAGDRPYLIPILCKLALNTSSFTQPRAWHASRLNGTAVAPTGGTPATHCLGNPGTALARLGGSFNKY